MPCKAIVAPSLNDKVSFRASLITSSIASFPIVASPLRFQLPKTLFAGSNYVGCTTSFTADMFDPAPAIELEVHYGKVVGNMRKARIE